MKKLRVATLVALSLLSGLAQADRLDDIKKNGVLRVSIPKKPEVMPKQISVKITE